ncbi:MAG: hypothetical protein M3452_03795 [Chloroflexota bacterium]|nr:hypothetical protein [Chloroflexota bacterium]
MPRTLNAAFLLSLLIVCSGFAAAFLVLRLLIPQTEIAAGIAGLFLGAGPSVQRTLEARLPRPTLPLPSLSGYERSWAVILLLGTISVVMATVAAPVGSLLGGPLTVVAGNLAALLALLPPAVGFAVGLYAGARSDRHATLVALAAVVLGYVVATAATGPFIDLVSGASATAPPGVPPGPPGAPGASGAPLDAPPDPRPILLGDGVGAFLLDNRLPLLVISSLLGVWRGQQSRLSGYVSFLLAMMPPSSRAAVVELAYEEGQRSSAAPFTAPGTPPRPET